MGNPYGRSTILPLTNQSGGSVAAGDLVYLDTAHDDSFTTGTTANYTGPIGVAQQAIGAGSVGLVLVDGYASLVNVNASVTRGHFGATYTAVKQATDAGASRATGTCMVFLKGGTTPDAFVWQPDLGAGSGMTNPMTTTGDMIYSSSGSTPARLAVGSAGKVISGGTTPAWAYPPGYELEYVEKTADTSITATVEASANTVITSGGLTFDGSTTVILEAFIPGPKTPPNAIYFFLFDGSTSQGYWGQENIVGNSLSNTFFGRRRLTPSNASHTYSIRATVDSGTGHTYCGSGGAGNWLPGYLRITVA